LKKCFNAHADSIDKLLVQGGNGGLTQCDASLRELAKVFFAPFRSHVAKYGEREQKLLLADITSGTATSKDILDELRNVSVSVNKLVASFKDASKRCCDMTEGAYATCQHLQSYFHLNFNILSGCAYPALISGLETCLSSYVGRYTTLMRRLDKRKSSAHSWNIFQQSLTLNQTAGELILQLEQLDISLFIDFNDSTKSFLGPDSKDRAFDQHHLFLLDSPGMMKLEDFFTKVQYGTRIHTFSGGLLED
jgi:hypothetical protein